MIRDQKLAELEWFCSTTPADEGHEKTLIQLELMEDSSQRISFVEQAMMQAHCAISSDGEDSIQF